MPTESLIETRIDSDIKDRATAVLAQSGLTVSDAVRLLLTRTADEGELPFAPDPAAYDVWFRAKVQEALDDPRPPIPHAEVEAEFDLLHQEILRSLPD